MDRKKCATCLVTKLTSEFYKHHRKGFQSNCIECRNSYNREHYRANKAKYMSRAKASKRKYLTELRVYLRSYLTENPCVVCGESDIVVLEFDHIDPSTKSFCIAQATRRGLPLAKVKSEIDKCQILCANCHKRKTAKDNNWWKT